MSNEHVHPFFRGLLDDVTRQSKRHLQNQKPRNRDRFAALMAGWQETGAEGISFATFQAGVERFEAVLRERDLDRQYEYEQRFLRNAFRSERS